MGVCDDFDFPYTPEPSEPTGMAYSSYCLALEGII